MRDPVCFCLSLIYDPSCTHRLADDRFSAQKALQTVVAGQQAENLLDFDDVPAEDGLASKPSGLAATQVLPAAKNLLATSNNPLDDLVSIFGGAGGQESSFGFGGPAPAQNGGGGLGGLGFASPMASGPGSGATSPTQGQKPQEDLLGLF